MKPTFDEAVRAAFVKHACPFDHLKSEDLIRDSDAFKVQFNADLHHTVISLAVDKNGMFIVSGSSCVSTEDYEVYLLAYGRALAFTREAGLKPKR